MVKKGTKKKSSRKSTKKASAKKPVVKTYPYNHFQYAAIILYLILSLFGISQKLLLIACGGLTLIIMLWMNHYPVRVSGLGLATHTYLLLGGLAALLTLRPLLLLFGSFQESFLFLLIAFMLLVVSVKAKRLLKKKLFIFSLVVGIGLSFIGGIVANILALVLFILIILGEAMKKW